MRAGLSGQVDVAKATSAGWRLTGQLLLDDARRLRPMLVSVAGPIEVACRFYRGNDGEHLFGLTVRGDFFLTCQRCGEPVAWYVDRHADFQAVASNDLAAQIDEALEPCVVNASGCVDLKQIAEDELMLCMPAVARHDTACAEARWEQPSDAGDLDEDHRKPFDVLKNLKP